MSAQDTASTESPQCAYFHFGLIVTGNTEQEHLPKLFKSLMETEVCKFDSDSDNRTARSQNVKQT